MGSLKGSQGPLGVPGTLFEKHWYQISWITSHCIQQSTFEVHKAGMTCFPFFRYAVQSFPKFYKFEDWQSMDQEFYTVNTYLIQIEMFSSFPFWEQKQPPTFSVTIKRSASTRLSNSLGCVCCVSAKAESELTLSSKRKGSPGSKYLRRFHHEMTEE